MSSLTTFPVKRTIETLFLSFDFISQLSEGETLTAAVVVSTVILGEDPTPSVMIVGAATIVNQAAIQEVTGGIAGVIYNLSCSVDTTDGNTLIMQGKLAVVDLNPFEV